MASTRIGGAPVLTVYYARFTASVVAGVVTSLVGAVVMALVLVVAFVAFAHTDPLYALRPIGTFLYGDAMLTAPTPAMYLAAAACHFGVAVVWGIIFGFAATLLRVDQSVGGSLALGIVIGLGSEIIGVNLLAPAIEQARWGQDLWTATVPPLYAWLAHVAFGLTFAAAPRVFRKLWLRWSGVGIPDADDPRLRQLS